MKNEEVLKKAFDGFVEMISTALEIKSVALVVEWKKPNPDNPLGLFRINESADDGTMRCRLQALLSMSQRLSAFNAHMVGTVQRGLTAPEEEKKEEKKDEPGQ